MYIHVHIFLQQKSLLGSELGDGICGALVQFGCYISIQIMICVDDTCGALVQLGCYHHSILVIKPTMN